MATWVVPVKSIDGSAVFVTIAAANRDEAVRVFNATNTARAVAIGPPVEINVWLSTYRHASWQDIA